MRQLPHVCQNKTLVIPNNEGPNAMSHSCVYTKTEMTMGNTCWDYSNVTLLYNKKQR